VTRDLSPFLNTGDMKEYFHVLGNIPVCIDLLNKKVIIGDKINAVSLRNLGEILSGPGE